MYIRSKCCVLLRIVAALCTVSTIIIVMCLVDSTEGSPLVTPIQNFEPSWTASSVGGTTIAIPFALKDVTRQKQKNDSNSDAVLLIFRSTIPSVVVSRTEDTLNRQRTKGLKSVKTLGGLHIVGPIYTSSDALPLSQSSQRWTFLGTTGICSMTGFAPDIDYLTRYLQQLVDKHRTTYESTSISMTTLVSPIKLVESLSEVLQEAGQWQGGRPFGVQILIIGRDEKTSSFGIFTLDPSGGYRRWRGAAAIGRNGKNVRDRLFEHWASLTNTNEFLYDGAVALSSGLQASVLSRIEESENLEGSDLYEAILIWRASNEFCVAQIDRGQIDLLRESILNKQKESSIK